MATGLPRTKWQRGPRFIRADGPEVGKTDVSLGYDGKKPEAEILRTPPSVCRQVWPESSGAFVPNRLYYGDNLPVLATLASEPEVCGKVRLVYIDPPYATRSVFQSRNQTDAYMDLLEGAHYLEFLRERLVFLRELLAGDGSIYLHLDDNMAFLAKAIMDEVFGRANFRNWITRKKCNPKNYTRRAYGNVADYILFYTKTDDYVWHRPVEAWTEQRAAREYQYIEPGTGRRYKKVPVHAPGTRNGETGQPWRGKAPPPGKHWQFPPRALDEMDARGEIYWSPSGNPRRKIYLDQSQGVPVQDVWLEFRDAHNQNIEVSGYPTEKNPALLTRIVEASSNAGDIVLDCFSGSGTTLSVASRLHRRWIGVDSSPVAVGATLRRFAKGLEPMGDFAGGLESADKDEDDENELTLPLFGPDESAKTVGKNQEAHGVIDDFVLFAQEPYHGDLGGIVRQWSEWCGERGGLRLSETPPPCKVRRAKTLKNPAQGRTAPH